MGKLSNNEAIIFASVVSVNSAPTESSTNLFALHSGTKIELIDHLGLNSIELAQKINDLMEEKILQHPGEYLWIHRRFKSTLGKNFYK